jgi:hypothetical protein
MIPLPTGFVMVRNFDESADSPDRKALRSALGNGWVTAFGAFWTSIRQKPISLGSASFQSSSRKQRGARKYVQNLRNA